MKPRKPLPIKAACLNCKFKGDSFKLGMSNHHHCEHPSYTQEDFDKGLFNAYDTLRAFYETCEKHEFKTKLHEEI
jgi:hypothetical protein